jgi:DNA polymerase III subunit gamma/tau
MTGEVLYRKWRPPRFADIVGQGPVTQTLTQAIATGRTSHAYLLCGPRGTGKTSTARVLAKALNCTLRPPGFGDPCGNCESCLAIERGNFVDLIEIDAASNRGIDEMRDLREKVRFSPTIGKYKVYIIDEAHALTNDAFNAFLKTLEEPPPHSVFILATTEPHRLPATIISRCQRYDFHRISPADVVERLAEIATAEGVDVAPEVLRTVSRASGGSLRDATNLLDQLITSFGANVSIEQVRELLGIGGEERAVALVKHLLTNNTTAALELINTVTSEGQDLRPLHRMTVDFLRAALLMKSGVKDSLELSKEAFAELSFAANNTTIEHLLRALRLFGQVSLKFDQPSPLPLELATVELSLDPAPIIVAQAAPMPAAAAPQQQQAQRSAPQATPQQPAYASPQRRPPQPQGQPTQGQQQRPPQAPAAARPATPPPPPVEIDPNAPIEERLVAAWPTILRALSRVPRRRFDVAALLRSSSKRQVVGTELVVRFTHTSNSERLQDELEDPRCRLEVERILEQALGASYTLKIEIDTSRNTANLNADQPGHLVRAAMSLGGQVIQNGTQAPEASAPEPETPVAEPTHAPEAPTIPETPPMQDAAPVTQDTPPETAIAAPVAEDVASITDEVPPEPAIAAPVAEDVASITDEVPPEPAVAPPIAEDIASITDEVPPEPAVTPPIAEDIAPVADETFPEPVIAAPVGENVASVSDEMPPELTVEDPITEDMALVAGDIAPAVSEPPPEPSIAPPVADESPASPAPEPEPELASVASNEAPVMARNLFNEMQAIPQPPSEEDDEPQPMAAAALPNNQIPADYFPGPDDEEMN